MFWKNFFGKEKDKGVTCVRVAGFVGNDRIGNSFSDNKLLSLFGIESIKNEMK